MAITVQRPNIPYHKPSFKMHTAENSKAKHSRAWGKRGGKFTYASTSDATREMQLWSKKSGTFQHLWNLIISLHEGKPQLDGRWAQSGYSEALERKQDLGLSCCWLSQPQSPVYGPSTQHQRNPDSPERPEISYSVHSPHHPLDHPSLLGAVLFFFFFILLFY